MWCSWADRSPTCAAGETWYVPSCKRRFPETEFDFINAGIPSTGSTPGAFRLMRDVFGHGPVDLLFEEAAVNDSTNFRDATEMLRGMEGIVRHARLVNPCLDVVVMHFVDPSKMAEYDRGKQPVVITQHEKVARHYGVPSINLALEVTQRINAGEFTWKDDFKDLHPSPFGQELYFNTIMRLFDHAWSKPVSAEAKARPHPMPEPLDPSVTSTATWWPSKMPIWARAGSSTRRGNRQFGRPRARVLLTSPWPSPNNREPC